MSVRGYPLATNKSVIWKSLSANISDYSMTVHFTIWGRNKITFHYIHVVTFRLWGELNLKTLWPISCILEV